MPSPGAQIALVVAVADNGVIGRAGALPWHLPDDLRHFKAVTLGKPLLMGRRTFESIGRPLPGRRNLVLSGHAARASAPPGIEYVESFEQARALTADASELCVIGGAAVFALALPCATRLYLTAVHAAVEGDTCFPMQELRGWRECTRLEHPADERHAYAMSFLTLERQSA
jgi:dihydrofolate reductase